MKKIYTKPGIVFDSFSLSTNIASCDIPFTHAQNICGIPDSWGVTTIFTLDVSGSDCDVSGDDNTTTNDGLCYHVPTAGYTLFSS